MALIVLARPQDPVALRFHMDGRAFDSGIPIHLLTTGMSDVQAILDRSYLGLIGRKRLSAEERTRFAIVSQGVQRSSLESTIEIIMQGVQLSLPVVGAIGPTGVWEYAKQAYELLKLLYAAISRNESPKIETHGDNTLQVTNESQTNIFNGPVLNIARLTQNIYAEVGKQVKNGDIATFRISSEKDEGAILISENEAQYFSSATSIDTNPVEVDCEIFDFNKFDDTGKLRVMPEQPLPERDYRFEVVGDQSDRDYIEAMLRKSVRVTCLRETTTDPLNDERVVRLQVLKVA